MIIKDKGLSEKNVFDRAHRNKMKRKKEKITYVTRA